MALPRVYKVVQDAAGNVVPQVLCSVLNQGTGVLATLWQDAAGTIPLSNPMTSDATYGSFGFYVQPGHFDITFSKPGYTFQNQMDFQVPADTVTLGTMATQNASFVAINGGNITGLTSLQVNGTSTLTGPIALGDPAQARAALELGTMAQQNASNISIAQATIAGPVDFTNPAQVRADLELGTMAQQNAASIVVTDAQVNNALGIGQSPVTSRRLSIAYSKASEYGIVLTPLVSDTGTQAILLKNLATTDVGSISTTATATAFNTTSDSRLKHDVTGLTGELTLVQSLRPVRFKWNADDSPGVGFLAQEVAAVVQGVISGEPDALDEEGRILPQMIDLSKLVPFLVGAIQTLAARLAVLEDAHG